MSPCQGEGQRFESARPLNMKITSSAFDQNKSIPSVYTCDGENTNPALTFSDVPENAKSLVLIMDDPDAPSGTFVHWVVYNIDPKTKKVDQNSVPKDGIQALTSGRDQKYLGPCPPSGQHRYFFKLYALDTLLSISETADKKAILSKMENHVIVSAELVGLYKR